MHTANNPSAVELLNPVEGIQVGDVIVVASTHDNLIALVDSPAGTYDSSSKDYTGYAKLALPDGLVQTVNGKPGPSVNLNPDDLNDDVTAHKFVLASDIDNWNDTRTTVGTTSGNWEDTRSTVTTTSGDWNDVRATVGATSAEWDSVYTSVNDTSGNWNSVYTSVNSHSGVFTKVENTSAEWDSVYTSVNDTSGNWNSVYTSVNDTSAEWDSVYTTVNSDSATNNTNYNQTTFVNTSGDLMTGSLKIDGGELEVGGNVTLAGDVIHQNDTGTRVSFNTDIIILETNGQEFITVDGTAPTPDAVIINNPAATAVHFQVKSISTDNSIFVNGDTGRVGVGTGAGTEQLTVSGGAQFIHDVGIEGDLNITKGSLNIAATGEYLSGGVPLHDIFSTDTDIHGDVTVHGSISSRDEHVVGKGLSVAEDTTISGNLSASNITASAGIHTLSGIGNTAVSGITQELNIGGHIIQIVNGLIVGVIDE